MSKKYALSTLIIFVTIAVNAQEQFPAPDAYVHTDTSAEVLNLEEFYLNLTYPAEIYETKKEGSVYLKVLINKKGKYVKHLVLKSADSLFTVHASRTVPMLRFKPAQSGGKAMATWVTVPVRFQVKNMVAKAKNLENPKTRLCEGLWTYYKDYENYWVKNVSEAVSFLIFDYGKSDSIVTAKRFTRNGSLISREIYLYQGDSLLRHGKFEFYLRDSVKIEEGIFHKDEREGEWKEYYDDGSRKAILNYKSGKRHGVYRSWYEGGILETEGSYSENKRDGELMRYDSLGRACMKIFYKDDKPVEVYRFDSAGNSIKDPNPEKYARRLPVFKKGNPSRFFENKFVYPMRAKREGIRGRVYVQFMVNTDGTVSDIEVVRRVGHGCDEAAVRAVESSSGMWEPGMEYGVPVRVRYTQPFTIR